MRCPRRPAAALAGFALAAFALAAPSPALAQEPARTAPGLDLPVVADTLPNGLRVLALRRPGAPVASFVLRFDLGSIHEGPGETGVAHFLEHLLFKGTTTIGTRSLARERAYFDRMDAAHDTLLALTAPGEAAGAEEVERLRRRIRVLEDSARVWADPGALDRLLTEAGARELNATTGYESTEYFVRLPSNRAELWFVVEADRMANPVFRDFYAERDVVMEERLQRVESSPGGLLSEAYHAAAFRVHPYGVPPIGHMADIRTYTREMVAAYHDRYYRPNNAIVAVVGDIDPAQVIRWARRYFGPIPRGAVPAPELPAEPPSAGERRVVVRFDAEPEMLVGWRVPRALHEDAPALAMLGQVLLGGRTGRLYRRLVIEDGVAASLSHSMGPGDLHPRLFTIGAQPLTGRTIAELEAALYAEIERLVRDGPTALELERVRNQLEMGDVARLGSDLGLAFQLAGSVALHGDWRETFRWGARLAAVTPDDVRRVAARYLVEENRVVAVREREEGAP